MTVAGLHGLKAANNLRSGLTLVEISIVLLVLSVLLIISATIISDIKFIKTPKSDGEDLSLSLRFVRQASVKSNQAVYVEFDIKENYYRAYRYNRSGAELKEEELIKKTGFGSQLIAIRPGNSKKITEGKRTIAFAPDGTADETSIFLGRGGSIEQTIIIQRFTGNIVQLTGEADDDLKDPDWKENLAE